MLSQTETISCLSWLKPASQIWPKRTLVRSLIKIKCQYKRRPTLSTIITENIQRCFMQSLDRPLRIFILYQICRLCNPLLLIILKLNLDRPTIYSRLEILTIPKKYLYISSRVIKVTPIWQLFMLHFFFSLQSFLYFHTRLLAVWPSLKPNFPHDMFLCKIEMLK